MAEINAPIQFSITGTITKISEASSLNTRKLNAESVIVTITRTPQDMRDFALNNPDAEGLQTAPPRQIDVWFAKNQIDEFGLNSILFEGNPVSVVAEERIENETQYLVNGEVEYHTASNYGGRNASHMSEMDMIIAGMPIAFIELIATRREHAKKNDKRRPTDTARPLNETAGIRQYVLLGQRASSLPEGDTRNRVIDELGRIEKTLSKDDLKQAKALLAEKSGKYEKKGVRAGEQQAGETTEEGTQS